MIMPMDDASVARLALMAAAIAHAEGWWVPGSIPRSRHNPGDVLADDGTPARHGSPLQGWFRLVRQCNRILCGTSKVYHLTMTWREVAEKWTGHDHDADWCRAVCDDLDVSPDSTLADYLEFPIQPPPAPPALTVESA